MSSITFTDLQPQSKKISSEKKTLSVRNCIYVIQAQTDQSMQNIASVIVGGQCVIEKFAPQENVHLWSICWTGGYNSSLTQNLFFLESYILRLCSNEFTLLSNMSTQ